MKIYIGFSKPKNHIFPIFSWLIRLFEQTEYSHVYVRWYSKGAQVQVCYEASGNEVKFLSNKVFLNKVNPVYEFELEITHSQYKKLLHFCMSNAGSKYGLKQVFGILLVRLLNLKKNPFSDNRKSWVCSELAGALLESVYGKSLNLDLDIAGPKDIYKYLNSKDFKKIDYNINNL